MANTPLDITISLVDQNSLIISKEIEKVPEFKNQQKLPLTCLLDMFNNPQIWNSIYLNRIYDLKMPKQPEKLELSTCVGKRQRAYFPRVEVKRRKIEAQDFGIDVSQTSLRCYTKVVRADGDLQHPQLDSWKKIKQHDKFMSDNFDSKRQNILKKFQYPENQQFQYDVLKFKKMTNVGDRENTRVCDVNFQSNPFVTKKQANKRNLVPKVIASVDINDKININKFFQADILAINDHGKSQFLFTNSNF